MERERLKHALTSHLLLRLGSKRMNICIMLRVKPCMACSLHTVCSLWYCETLCEKPSHPALPSRRKISGLHLLRRERTNHRAALGDGCSAQWCPGGPVCWPWHGRSPFWGGGDDKCCLGPASTSSPCPAAMARSKGGMDRQLAMAQGWHMSWEAVSSDSAVGLKFWEVRRTINLPFFLKF